LGTRAIPAAQSDEEQQLLEDEILPFESQSVRFIGVCPAGTLVENIVDIGERGRVRCTIAGERVTAVKWALTDDEQGAVDAVEPSTQE
jgi:hypothetical protein